MGTDSQCLFCRIIEGELPSTKIYEDEAVVCFMDIAPWTRGHCLVVPREHAATIFELSEEALVAVAKAAKKIAPALVEGLEAQGLNLFQSNGSAAWQAVDHFHLHLLPRTPGDGLQPPRMPEPGDAEEIQTAAAAVRSALGA